MKAWDLTITAPSRPGVLADLATELGKEDVNIEGMCAFEHKGEGVVHLLVEKREAALPVIKRLKLNVADEREVLVEEIEDRPGVFGERARHIAEKGINLTAAYLATNTRVVLAADDLAALTEAWRAPATASRS